MRDSVNAITLLCKNYSAGQSALFIIGEKELKIKESMLLVCGDTEDKSVFDGIISTYKLIAYYQK